jgi:hypothetical protein
MWKTLADRRRLLIARGVVEEKYASSFENYYLIINYLWIRYEVRQLSKYLLLYPVE